MRTLLAQILLRTALAITALLPVLASAQVTFVEHQPTDNAIWLDYDRDGFIDLYTGNLKNPDTRNLLINRGNEGFLDVLESAGLSALADVNVLGAGFADLDNDGDLDLIVANPHFIFLWDGKDTSGHALASGVYLYELRARARVETRKLTLLR